MKFLSSIFSVVVILLLIPALMLVEGVLLLLGNFSFAKWYSNKYWKHDNHHAHIILYYIAFGIIIYGLIIIYS